MKQINTYVLVGLLLVCLTGLGFTIASIIEDGFKVGKELFYQVGAVVPFLTSAIAFGVKLYAKQKSSVTARNEIR